MKSKLLVVSILFFSGIILLNGQESNWTHFRGSKLNAVSDSEKAPLEWNDSLNVKWKTAIHGRGWSSPVIFDDQIWITTATTNGSELSAICVDFESGAIIHDILLFKPPAIQGKHAINSYATPTPAIEKGFVYVHFGSFGTACIRTTDGKVVWKRDDMVVRHVQGPGSSPLLYKNLLILHLEGTDLRYVTALDKATGETVWKTDRPAEPYEPLTVIGRKAYITPLLINVNGKDLMISNGSAVCIAYDPADGSEVWRVVRGAESTVSMPFYENGTVYFYTGFMVDTDKSEFSEIVAVDPSGKGDVTSTHVKWQKRVARMQLLTPVISNGLIYTVDTQNNMLCIDAGSGKDVWTYRVRSDHNASPVLAAGNIYFFSIRGETTIIKPGPVFSKVAENRITDQIWATPAFLRNVMILRTDKYLSRIEQ